MQITENASPYDAARDVRDATISIVEINIEEGRTRDIFHEYISQSRKQFFRNDDESIWPWP